MPSLRGWHFFWKIRNCDMPKGEKQSHIVIECIVVEANDGAMAQ